MSDHPETYDKAYFDWFESRIEDPGVHFGIAHSIHSVFKSNLPVVEVGCGRGYIVKHLQSLYGSKGMVEGIDISKYATENPLEGIEPNTVWCRDIRHGFGLRRFGLVFSWQLLEHMESEEEASRAISNMGMLGLGYQVHSIRILESGAGEDKTHTLMKSRTWWINAFSQWGGLCIDPAVQEMLERAGSWKDNPELFVLRRI